MAPYLERHIRLADRRGLLQGARLSKVQDIAVELAMALDERKASNRTIEELKMALVTSNPGFWMGHLYPDALSAPTPEDDYDLEDTEGTWIMPEITEEEYRSMEQELAARGGLLSIEDIEGDDEGEWV